MVVALFAAGLLLALLEGVSPPEFWSFEVAGIPPWVFPCFIVVGLAALLSLRNARHEPGRSSEPKAAGRSPATWLAIFVISAAVLWLLRCNRSYGDGDAIVRFIRDGVVFHKREPLSPTLFLGVHRTLGEMLGWAPRTTIQVVTTGVGAAGCCALIAIASRLAPTVRSNRWLAACAFLSCGSMQLFAGYVENYTVPTVLMLFAINSALAALEGADGFVHAFAFWTASCMFHLSGVVFGPAFVCLAWCQRDRWLSRPVVTSFQVVAVTLLPLCILGVLMHSFGYLRAEESGFGGGDGSMFVPLFEVTGYGQYLFLRPDHLRAIANEQLLVGPLGLVMVVVGMLLGYHRERTEPRTPISSVGFLLLVAGGFFALTLIWNPDYGPLLDWDLFGPVGFYLNIAGVALVVRGIEDDPRRVGLLLAFVTVVNASRALPFILHNHT